jgi:hypothetical protein
MKRGISRGATLLGSVVMALALGVQPAAAAIVVHNSGDYGVFQFDDNHDSKRGANCDYETHRTNGSYLLDDISVRAPKVYAIDTGGGIQHQLVGWKYKIQVQPLSGPFHTVFTSSVVKAHATDSAPAAFSRRTWKAPENPSGNYRVEVSLYWFQPNTTNLVAGKIIADIEYYNAREGANSIIRQTDCYQAFG